MTVSAIITAAGNSIRFGTGQKKEYSTVNEKPILAHTIMPFLRVPSITHLIITVPPGEKESAEKLITPFISDEVGTGCSVSFTEGGETRRESVLKGLRFCQEFQPHYVLIHDGARPWVTVDLIQQVLDGVKKFGACAPAVIPPDAIKQVDGNGFLTAHYGRKNTVGIQTPQGFIYSEIVNAHEQADGDGKTYIDDTEISEEYGRTVYTVPGDPKNFKITYFHDMERSG